MTFNTHTPLAPLSQNTNGTLNRRTHTKRSSPGQRPTKTVPLALTIVLIVLSLFLTTTNISSTPSLQIKTPEQIEELNKLVTSIADKVKDYPSDKTMTDLIQKTSEVLKMNESINALKTMITSKEQTSPQNKITPNILTLLNIKTKKSLNAFVGLLKFEKKDLISKEQAINFKISIIRKSEKNIISSISKELNKGEATNTLLLSLYVYFYHNKHIENQKESLTQLKEFSTKIEPLENEMKLISKTLGKLNSLHNLNIGSSIYNEINTLVQNQTMSVLSIKEADTKNTKLVAVKALRDSFTKLNNIKIKQEKDMLTSIKGDGLGKNIESLYTELLINFNMTTGNIIVYNETIKYLLFNDKTIKIIEIIDEQIQRINGRIGSIERLSIEEVGKYNGQKEIEIVLEQLEELIGEYSKKEGEIRGMERWNSENVGGKIGEWKESLEKLTGVCEGSVVDSETEEMLTDDEEVVSETEEPVKETKTTPVNKVSETTVVNTQTKVESESTDTTGINNETGVVDNENKVKQVSEETDTEDVNNKNKVELITEDTIVMDTETKVEPVNEVTIVVDTETTVIDNKTKVESVNAESGVVNNENKVADNENEVKPVGGETTMVDTDNAVVDDQSKVESVSAETGGVNNDTGVKPTVEKAETTVVNNVNEVEPAIEETDTILLNNESIIKPLSAETTVVNNKTKIQLMDTETKMVNNETGVVDDENEVKQASDETGVGDNENEVELVSEETDTGVVNNENKVELATDGSTTKVELVREDTTVVDTQTTVVNNQSKVESVDAETTLVNNENEVVDNETGVKPEIEETMVDNEYKVEPVREDTAGLILILQW